MSSTGTRRAAVLVVLKMLALGNAAWAILSAAASFRYGWTMWIFCAFNMTVAVWLTWGEPSISKLEKRSLEAA